MQDKIYKPLITPAVEWRDNNDSFTKESIISPLESGAGITIGNALRRAMLSAVEGCAVTSVIIEGTNHEFSKIDGIVEDVLQIILNIKQLVIKNKDGKPGVLRINKTGPGVVTAADITCDSNLEVVNKDLVIANLAVNGSFVAELFAENGRGYKLAQWPEGVKYHDSKRIYVDSMFSPVKKVTYEVSKTRVGDKIDHDKLTMQIETNGSVDPKDVFEYAISVLLSQFNSLLMDDKKINFGSTNFDFDDSSAPSSGSGDGFASMSESAISRDESSSASVDIFLKSIDDLDLSVRAYNCLVGAGIERVVDLVNLSEDDGLKIKNFGRKSLKEVREILDKLGLKFGMNIKKLDLKKALKKQQESQGPSLS